MPVAAFVRGSPPRSPCRPWAIAVLAAACHRAPRTSTTTLVLAVTDRGAPVGARVLLVDDHGQPLHMGNLDLYGKRQGAAACAIAPGVVASWDGLSLATGSGEVPVGADPCVPSPAIPYGHYKV